MRRLNPTTIGLAIAGLILLLILFVALRGKGVDEDKLSNRQVAEAEAGAGADVQAAPASPSNHCSTKQTYDLIKLQLFRQAADTRGSDQKEFDRLAAYSVIRMNEPRVISVDDKLGTTRCSGRLSLDLPPGVAVVGSRRTLAAQVDYTLQPAADGSGEVVFLEKADPIIVPLATLTRTAQAPATPATPAETPVVPAGGNAEPLAEQDQSEWPSFNCRDARSRSEIAVCESRALSALDRQMASQYRRALDSASPDQRQILQRTRDEFLSFRDRCGSDECVAQTYRGRMREISDIMAGRWQP
jgi:uncharacterized protein YecT (DUF1311 family)